MAQGFAGSGQSVVLGPGLSAGTQSVASGTVAFSDSNGVSFGMSGSSRITASVGAGATATGNLGAFAAGTQTATSGTIVFSDSNNVSFGMSGSTRVTASIPAGATATGNFGALSAGTQQATSGTVVLSDSNGVSFGMSGSTRITASVAAGATATGNLGALAAGTQTGTSGTVVLSDSNGLSFGMSGSTRITGSHDGVRSVSAGTTRATGGEVVFSNSNGVTFGANGQTITASVAAGGGNTGSISAGTTRATLGEVVFSNSNGVSFGVDGQTVTGSVAAGATATGNLGAIAGGTQTATSGTIVFSDSNNVSFGMSGSTRMTASIPAGATATGNFGALAAGTQTATSGTIVFSDSNGITFGMSGSTRVTASHNGITSQSNQQMTLFATGNTTQSSTGTSNASSLIFRGDGVASVGITNGSIVVSVPAGGGGLTNINLSAGTTSQNLSNVVFSNSNGVSFGLNGSTITASAGEPTLSSYEPWPIVANSGTGAVSLQTNTSGPLSLFPFELHRQVRGEFFGLVASMNFTTGGTSSFNQSGTLQWGLYTRPTGANSTALSLAGSGSFSYAASYNNSTITVSQPGTSDSAGFTYTSTTSAGLNITSGYTGLKLLNLPLGSTLTPGQYWLGIYHRNSSSSFNSGIRISLYGLTHTVTGLAPMGSFATAYSTGTAVQEGFGGNIKLGAGSYTLAALTSLAATVSLSQVTQNIGFIPYARISTRV